MSLETPPITYRSVVATPAFPILWIAFFLTSLGNVLLLSTLVLTTYLQSSSSFLAGVVYVVQWFLPVLLLPLNGWINNRFPIKHALIAIQLCAAIFSVVAGFTFYHNHFALFLVALSIRGFFDNTLKSAGTVALKNYMPPPQLPLAITLYDSSRYLGTLTGGALAMLLITKLNSFEIALINATLLIATATLYLFLYHKPAINPQTLRFVQYWKNIFSVLHQDRLTAKPLATVVFITVVFQGFHYVARTTLPLEYLKISLSSAAMLQGILSFAFLFGALWVGVLIKHQWQSHWSFSLPFNLFYIALALVATIATLSSTISFGAYFLYLFFFEIAYSLANNAFTVRCPIEHLSYLNAFKSGCATAGMGLVTLIDGALVDYFGFFEFTIGLSVLTAVVGLVVLAKKK